MTTYLYSDQKRHIADPEDLGISTPRRRALCGRWYETYTTMTARYGRRLSGDLTLGRRIARALRAPVCSWCSRRAAEQSQATDG